MLKKRFIAALCLVLVIAGCTTKTQTPQEGLTTTQPALAESGSSSGNALNPPANTPGQDTVEVLPQSPLQLLIDNPKDGDTVTSQDVTITGRTAPGGVVSIDDQFTVADQKGAFSLAVHLDSGLQMITVEASNNSGEDVIVTLSVDIQPE